MSQAVDHPRLRDRLGFSSVFSRLSRRSTPSTSQSETVCCPSASVASLASTADNKSARLPIVSYTCPSTPSIGVTSGTSSPLTHAQDAPREDAMSKIWAEAVTECQHTLGADLLQTGFGSKEAVIAYTQRREQAEDALQKDHWHKMRARVVPLARVLEKLCGPIGDTLGSTAFPPSKIIFSAVGLILSACVKTHEELAQVGTALDEIKMHLRVVEAVAASQPGDLLRDASVKLLAQVVSVLAAIVKMTREGRLRLWLQSLVDVRPLSSALQDLGRLATRHHEVVVAVTYEKVTQVMSSIADGRVAQDWVHQRLLDLLQVAREVQDNTSLTKEEIAANRAILHRVELLFYRQAEDLREIKTIAEFDKVAQWLKYPDPSFKLSRLLDDRAEGTGSWFLDGDVFTDFRQGKTKSVLLSGKAGSGKSTMIAAAAQALQAYCASFVPESLVLVHLFDATNGASAQELHSLLSALLYQLALKSPICASTISEARKKAAESGYTTKFDKERLLMGLLRSFSQCTFIVIDALDEANEADVLPFLARLRDIPTVSLLSSRRTATSAGAFDIVISIDDNDTDSDIGTLLDIAMSAGGALERIKDRDGVRQTLLAGAEGNFRWTMLVIQELKSIAGMPGKVRQRLKTLPESLEALYKACLDSISPADREDVRRLLLWLVRSVGPLSLDDFADLMSFDYTEDMPVYDLSLRPEPEAVVQMVGSMFICVSQNFVRLAHASVRDFLLNLPPSSPFYSCDTDYGLMARTGLAYIAFVASGAYCLNPQSQLIWTWVQYVALAGDDLYASLEPDIIATLSKASADPSVRDTLNITLRTAAETGHDRLTELLLDYAGDVNSFDTIDWTALHLAAWGGHLRIVASLLERGAAIAPRTDMQGTPLMFAAQEGHADVVRLLLDRGAPLDDSDAEGFTALHFAVQNGHVNITSLLLERGANSTARTKHKSTPLMTASWSGYEEITRLLLSTCHGNLEDRDNDGDTALHSTALRGHVGVVRLLLDGGATIDALNDVGRTPLHWAARGGHVEVIDLLVSRGAALEAVDEDGWTPLYLAAYGGEERAAARLLELGSDPKIRAKDGTTILDAIGQHPQLSKDAERDMRIRELLVRAGLTEEIGRSPIESLWTRKQAQQADEKS